MTKTITVEGDLTAVDTATNLTTQGSTTAPVRTVPSGVTRIKDILAAVAQDGAAAGSASYLLRLGGAAVQNGEQTLVVGAGGTVAVQAGSDQAPALHTGTWIKDADIEVTEGDNVTVQGEMMGSDLGTARMVVTLIFA